MAGKLYLLPVGLGPSSMGLTHPPEVLARLQTLQYFAVERAKTARAELRRLGHPASLQSLAIEEIPEKPQGADLDRLLAPCVAGHDLGVMSEAGCPAVADPGALLVRRAHELGVEVVPMVGPSSLLLALMASGLNGQGFAFHGYLPIEEAARAQSLRKLEQESQREQRTQLFIETPYRNDAMFDGLLKHCQPNTRLCVARAITTSQEWIKTLPVHAWRKAERPELARLPTVFLLLA